MRINHEERPEKAFVFFVSSQLILRGSLCGNRVCLDLRMQKQHHTAFGQRRVSHGADFDD
jgi:hypothetical protein